MDPTTYTRNLSQVVRSACDSAGVSDKSLSEQTGIGRSTLQNRFKFGSFKVDELAAIASVLGLTPNYFTAAVEQVAS